MSLREVCSHACKASTAELLAMGETERTTPVTVFTWGEDNTVHSEMIPLSRKNPKLSRSFSSVYLICSMSFLLLKRE